MKKIYILLGCIALLLITYLVSKKPVANSLNAKGLSAFESKNFIEAEGCFSKALKWKRKSTPILTNLTKSQLAQHDTIRVIQSLEALQKLAPDSAETAALQGQFLVLTENYSEALAKLNEALELDSLLAYAYFYRAIARANLNQLEAAANDYLKAQNLNNSNDAALREGAAIYAELENFDAAIESYDKLLELEPSNVEIYAARAEFKLKILDYTGALRDFGTALDIKADYATALYGMGKVYAKQENYPEAIGYFQKSLDQKYKIPESHYNISLAALKMNDLKRAQRHLNQCTSISADNSFGSKSFFMLGVIDMMENKNKNAVPQFTKAIELDSSYTEAYYNRGIAHGILQQYKPAVSDMEKCLQLGKSTADVYFALGVYKISQSQYQEGCDELATAVDMGHHKAISMQKQYCD